MATATLPSTNDGYGDESADDLLATIDRRAKEMRARRSDWIDEAKTCYEFVAAHQWSDEDLQLLKDARRPTVTIPLVGPVIDVVAGLEVTNRQEVQYLPRELGDAGPNEVLTGAGQWVRDECNAEDEESEAFLDMATCGEGWTETRLDYEYDADGMILTERVDPLEILPDDRAIKKNYRDMEDLIREKMVPVQWVKDTWPEKAGDIDVWQAAAEDKEFDGEAHRTIAGDQYRASNISGGGKSGHAKDQVKLQEYQYKKREPFYRVADPASGQIMELTPGEHTKLQERAKQIMGQPLKSVRQAKCIHYRCFKVGNVLLEKGQTPDPGAFTYKAMTAKRDRKKGCWYGIVRPMLDPQRWVNKFFSQSMHILNTNAKGGVVVEKDAVDDMAKFESSWAHSDKVTIVRPGANTSGKIVPKVPPPFPTELQKLLEFCVTMIYKVSGISPEMLGTVDREQAAVLEYQRKQAGVTILATLFDALRKYRKEQGRSALYLIRTYLSDGRLIRIVGKQGAKYVQLLNDSDAKYDTIIDEAPSSPNQKEKTWVILQSLLPILLKAGIQLPPEVFDYLPLPQSLLDAIKKPDPAKQQAAQMQQQLQMRGAVAEVEKVESEALENKASAQLKIAQAGQQQQSNHLEGMAELGRVEVERDAAMHEIAIKREKTAADIESQRQDTQRKILETLAKIEADKAATSADIRRQDETARANTEIKANTAAAQTAIQAKTADEMAKQKAAATKAK